MGSPLVTFPGTSGNYVSTADVNLLDADTAHSYQGTWVNSYQSINVQHVDVVSSLFGGKVTQWESSGAGQMRAPTQNTLAVAPTDVISVYARVRQITGPANTTFFLGGQWVQADGTTSISYVALSNSANLTDGEWRWCGGTVTAPELAGFFRVITYANGVDSGDVYQLDVATAFTGTVGLPTDASFIPSLRIVGDLDIEIQYADTQSLADIAYLLELQQGGSNGGYAIVLRNDQSRYRIDYTKNDGTTRSVTSGVLTWTDGQVYTMRSTWDVSAGTVKIYRDGVEVSTATNAAYVGGGRYTDATVPPLRIAALNGTSTMFDGDIYYAEVRDGIDGPVAARFSGADVLEAVT